jgi:hypothetical protein
VRIVPYEGDDSLDELETLSLLIKAVPFEGGYAPAFMLVAPSDNHFISIDEANCLMDGVEIASSRLDELIAMMLQSKIAERLRGDSDDEVELMFEVEEDDEDDNGEGD